MFTVRTGDRLRPPVIRNESCECTLYNYIVHNRKFDSVGLEVHGSLRDFSHADQETVVGFSIAMTVSTSKRLQYICLSPIPSRTGDFTVTNSHPRPARYQQQTTLLTPLTGEERPQHRIAQCSQSTQRVAGDTAVKTGKTSTTASRSRDRVRVAGLANSLTTGVS